MSKFEIIPQNYNCDNYIDKLSDSNKYGEIIKSERHLMHIDLGNIDEDKLIVFLKHLPNEYTIKYIDEELYNIAENDDFLCKFIMLFKSYEEFVDNGLGYFIIYKGNIVGGISSYVRYKDIVEIQIAIKPNYRNKHLATSVGAKMILECKRRGLYPNWECANPISEQIACKLGYRLKKIIQVYKYIYE